ncbi:MAG: hypothetical protein RR620_08525 [Clostridium sp.]
MDKRKFITIGILSAVAIIAIFIGVKLVTKPSENLDIANTVKVPQKEIPNETKEISNIEIQEDDVVNLFAMNFPKMPVPKITDSLSTNFVYSYIVFLEQDYNLLSNEFNRLDSGEGSPSDLLALIKPSILITESNMETLIKLKARAPENKIFKDIIMSYNEYLSNLKSQKRYLLDRVIEETEPSALNGFLETNKNFDIFKKKITTLKSYFEVKYPEALLKFEEMVKEYIVKNKDYDLE